MQWKQIRDLLLELNRNKNGSNQPRFAISFSSPLDAEQYNYVLIYCIVALSMCEPLGIQREDFIPSTPPCPSVTLSLSPCLHFHIFKCQLCLCGLPLLQSFDVFRFSVCEWELIIKCPFRCFFIRSSKFKIKEVKLPLLLTLDLFLSADLSLKSFVLECKRSIC